jgi:hypothetical protein
MGFVVPHCLDIGDMIGNVFSTANHQGSSFYKVFSCTLSLVLCTVRGQINLDANIDPNVDNVKTDEMFDFTLHEFFDAHDSLEDH